MIISVLITFRESLEQSRNVPTIKIAEQMGVSTILNFSKRIGFNAKELRFLNRKQLYTHNKVIPTNTTTDVMKIKALSSGYHGAIVR